MSGIMSPKMSYPIYMNVVSGLFAQVHMLLDKYVNNGYTALAAALKYPLGIVVTLYIVLLGYSITQGWVKLSFSEFVKSALKIGLIYSFAMNWEFFSSNVVQLIQEGSNQLGGIIYYANTHTSGGFQYSDNGIEAALQSILVHFTKMGVWFWKQGGFRTFAPYIEAIVIWGLGVLLVLVAMFQLILANIVLSILFVSAPLFITFALFKPTQGIFDRWLGKIISYALLIFFVSVVLGFVLSMTNWAVSGIDAQHLLNLRTVSFVPISIVVCIGIGLLKHVVTLSHDIGNAVSTVSSSSNFGNRLGTKVLTMGSISGLALKGVIR